PINSDVYLPDLSCWTVDVGRGGPTAVLSVSLKQLRQWWALEKGPTHTSIPYAVPVPLRLPLTSWKLFWSLCLPPGVFTPWWRLLHDCIANASKLHQWKIPWISSPLCQICQLLPETVFHFMVQCPSKWHFWCRVLQFGNLGHAFPTMTSVWVALTSLKSESGEMLPASTLCLLGTALSALWTHHYRCIFDNEFWNPEA
ncbi:hypothetical protein BD560DRAFT_302895, partial [Blakeslea trispora]